VQVVEQEHGDNPTEGVRHGDRTCVDGTGTVIQCARVANPTPTTTAGNVGSRIAVRYSYPYAAAVRIGTRFADRVGVTHEP
jgi:hypothetical protein